jgi:zinc D-Ala-D-Ala dipeptidase
MTQGRMRWVVSVLCASVLLAPAVAQKTADPNDRSGFVDAAKVVPGLVLDIRYFGTNNFVGKKIDGYSAPLCLLTREAAAALAKAQEKLKAEGYGLKVFDCYRPQRAVNHFGRWAADLADQSTKATYYPNLEKNTLIPTYIAKTSGHSRGSTTDLTLVALGTGKEVDMGSPFDLFDTISNTDDKRVTGAAHENRLRLQKAMTEAGFSPYAAEWWHFSLKSPQPYSTPFDFVVE